MARKSRALIEAERIIWKNAEIVRLIQEAKEMEANLPHWLKKVNAKADIDTMEFRWEDMNGGYVHAMPIKPTLESTPLQELDEYVTMLHVLRNSYDAVVAIEKKLERRAALEKQLKELLTDEQASEFTVTVNMR